MTLMQDSKSSDRQGSDFAWQGVSVSSSCVRVHLGRWAQPPAEFSSPGTDHKPHEAWIPLGIVAVPATLSVLYSPPLDAQTTATRAVFGWHKAPWRRARQALAEDAADRKGGVIRAQHRPRADRGPDWRREVDRWRTGRTRGFHRGELKTSGDAEDGRGHVHTCRRSHSGDPDVIPRGSVRRDTVSNKMKPMTEQLLPV